MIPTIVAFVAILVVLIFVEPYKSYKRAKANKPYDSRPGMYYDMKVGRMVYTRTQVMRDPVLGICWDGKTFKIYS